MERGDMTISQGKHHVAIEWPLLQGTIILMDDDRANPRYSAIINRIGGTWANNDTLSTSI